MRWWVPVLCIESVSLVFACALLPCSSHFAIEKKRKLKKFHSVQMAQKATGNWLESTELGLVFWLNCSLSNIDSSPSNSFALIFWHRWFDLTQKNQKSVCWEMFWETWAYIQLISTSMGSSLLPASFFIHHGVDLVNCALKTAPFAPLTLGSSVLSTEEHSSNGCKTPFSWNLPCKIWFQNRLSSL